ncbi:sensor histidine kinase YxjM [Dictyobacter sp. S3.2.2.5]|uniref:histidine kinase n=1 Tax=Dictyobacter halimunensis TaxID=3026934 RepID=A0ABQ6FRA0_9CHLR|nr:sensor histidine kinase YxjM [Dictyobacter sp. S3.2.2.5]
MYLSVFLLVLINRNFVWNFYMVFGLCFGLFSSRRLLLMVSLIALTIFAFQGLLAWPVNAVGFFNIVSQGLTIYSLTCMSMLFQKLIAERFTRERLFRELQHTNTRLEEAHRRLEQSVAQEQELAVLRERTRLAREMHDTLGHALVLIAVKLEAAQRLRERDPNRCNQELESTKAIARESMAGLRASIADLRSPVLEHERFQQVLERSVSELRRRAGLHVTYTLETDVTSLPEALEEVLWKVSQEALTNIEKHADATHVDLRIGQQGDQLTLLIHDDGIGLPGAYYKYREDGHLVCLSPQGHYGLRGMFERVEHAGGRFAVRSTPGGGTSIEVTLPIMAVENQVDSKKAQETQL